MKKYFVSILLIVLLVLDLGGISAVNAAVCKNFVEGNAFVNVSGINSSLFDENKINALGCEIIPSLSKDLPVKVQNYLLPPGAVVKSIEVLHVTYKTLKLQGKVEFSGYSVNTENGFRHSANAHYILWEPGTFRQYRFVKVFILPFTLSSSDSLKFINSVSFRINFQLSDQTQSTLFSDNTFSNVANIVFENFDSAALWYKPLLYTPEGKIHYDYLIIVPNKNMIPALSNFIEYKEKVDGLLVKVVTMNEIKVSSEGKTVPDKIRNFLRKNYLKWGLKYLLIIGSPHSVPMCYMYPKAGEKRDENGLSRPIGRTPTDFYYAELTSNWNTNKNGFPGEFDRDTKSVEDFYPDLFVGRIPFDRGSEVQKVLRDDIAYEEEKESFRKSALLVGAMLYYGEENTSRQDGALALNFASDNYLKPAGFTTFSMYEKAGTNSSFFDCDVPISENNFVKAMRSKKYGLILLNAHGSPQYIARKYWVDSDKNNEVDNGEIKWETLLSTSDIDKYLFAPSIFYSASCETAWPEKDNIGDEILLKGGAAYIGSSRIEYGSGTIDPILEGFVRNYAQNNLSLGASLDISLFNMPHNSIYDFVDLYDFNLYGDPSLRVNTVNYTGFSLLSNNYSFTIEQGGSASIRLSIKKNPNSDGNVVFGFSTDVDGISGKFINLQDGNVELKVSSDPNTPEGKFVLVISAKSDADNLKIFSIPMSFIVEKHSFSTFDLNKDGVVDGEDLIIFARSFGLKKGEKGFDARSDFNNDGVVNGEDLILFIQNFSNKGGN